MCALRKGSINPSRGSKEELIDSYIHQGISSMWMLDRQHPSSEENKESALGQSIKTSKDHSITRVKFRMMRSADAEGTVVAHLYASTGTYGVDCLPTGSPLAISNPVDVNSILTTSPKYAEFTFPSDQQYLMVKDIVYCIVAVLEVLISGIVYVNNQVNGIHAGNLNGWTGSDGGRWGYLPDRDTNFYLYGIKR